MRTFNATLSRHRPDGLVTIWISAVKGFCLKELAAKQRRIIFAVEHGYFPIHRFISAIQCGYDIFDSDCKRFFYDEDTLAEFIVDPPSVFILLRYLLMEWGGFWNVQWCDWSDDPWDFKCDRS